LQIRLVLLEQPVACVCVFGFRDGVFQVGLFQSIEGYDYAVDFGKGIV
jgi:hypothetical protein